MKASSTDLSALRKSIATVKQLDNSQQFLDFLRYQAEVQAEIEATWAVVRERMDKYDVTKLSGDWGYITMAERRSFKATGKVAPRFFKQTLDSTKVSAYEKISGHLPAGVDQSSTKFLQKRIKEV